MKAFGIFEGGGAKGLAHVGALKAAEEKGIEFIGVAGASAGSIIASLIAANYRSDELYETDEAAERVFDFDFTDFLDGHTWVEFQKFKKMPSQLFQEKKVGLR